MKKSAIFFSTQLCPAHLQIVLRKVSVRSVSELEQDSCSPNTLKEPEREAEGGNSECSRATVQKAENYYPPPSTAILRAERKPASL